MRGPKGRGNPVVRGEMYRKQPLKSTGLHPKGTSSRFALRAPRQCALLYRNDVLLSSALNNNLYEQKVLAVKKKYLTSVCACDILPQVSSENA